MEWEKIATLIVLSISGWSALALLLDKRGYLTINRYFATLLAVLCVSQIFIYALLVNSPAAFILGQIASASIWLKGPLLWQLANLLLGKHRELKSICWHFCGFPIALLAAVILPGSQWWWHLFGGCLSLFIVGKSALLLWQQRDRLFSLYDNFKNTAVFWLLHVVVGMLVLLLADVALFAAALVMNSFSFTAIKLINFGMSLYLCCIAFFSIYRPDIFFRSKFGEHVAEQPATTEEAPAELSPEIHTRSLELSESTASALCVALEQLMASAALYKQEDLSLAGVAQALGISVHQTSELLNVHMRTNFYAYVNGYRLQHAARLLQDPNCQLRVLDILFESGFNNKNSFYREFRQRFGVAPLTYRNQHLANEYVTSL